MSLGLIWFTLADSTVAPNFNLTGEEPWAHRTSLSALGEVSSESLGIGQCF